MARMSWMARRGRLKLIMMSSGYRVDCTVVPAGVDVGMWGMEKEGKDVLSKDVCLFLKQ